MIYDGFDEVALYGLNTSIPRTPISNLKNEFDSKWGQH